ncbi:MAG: zinc ribbon domain-containing protein [Thermoplasmata archaeon]
MAGSFLKENHKFITILLCVLSLALILTSQFVSWFVLDADKNIAGLADINLNADFYESGVSFKATAKVEAGGLGGMIGGIADLGSIAGDGNITIEDEIKYWEGLEKFQGMVGVLFDTTKNADYTVNLQTWNSTNTRVWVNTHTDIIPWWPEGLAQEITITVKLNQTDNVKNIRINKVRIDLYKDWNVADRKYDSVAKAWEIEPGDFLYDKGDQKVYKHGIALQKDWGDKIGIITRVDMTMTDIYNNSDNIVLEPFTSTSHPQKMVNIIPITQGQFVSIIFMFVAFPVTIVAIILAIAAIVLTFLQKRRRVHLLFSAAILELFAVIFFVNGANTLLGLIEFLTEEDFYWNVMGLAIPILGCALLFIAFLLEMKYRPKEEPGEEIKFDISEAISEKEEEEEEEGFECPQCGRVFTEFVPVCPDCGAEFEGVEEDEEEEGEEEGEGEIEEKEAETVEEREEPKKEIEDGEFKEPKKRPKKRRKKRTK